MKSRFQDAMNSIITEKDKYISAYKDIIKTLTNDKKIKEEQKNLENECEVLSEMMRKMINENARTTQNQEDYMKRYNALVSRYDKAKSHLNELEKAILAKNAKCQELERFLKMLKKQENLLSEFDEELWLATVHQLVVKSESEFVFVFRDGRELEWNVE